MARVFRVVFAAGCAGWVLAGASVAQLPNAHHLFSFRGEELLDQLGRSVCFPGDLDGDGHADIATGATRPLTQHAGYLQVLSGAHGKALFRADGPFPADKLGDRFGAALAPLGDVDGDGVPDLAVGAPHDDDVGPEAGAVSVISGATGAILATAFGQASGDLLGAALAPAGDLDGDGVPDVLAGAPGGSRVAVLSGEWFASTATGATPASSQVLRQASGTGRFGDAVAGIGDVTADGLPDFAVGAPLEDDTGIVHLVSGLTGLALVSLPGVAPGDLHGSAVASAGDLDLDGAQELLVGAPLADTADTDAGRVEVLSGEWMAQTAQGLAPATNKVVFAFAGGQPGDHLGRAIGAAGDVDGDGTPDVLAGATAAGTLTGVPYARVWSGLDGSPLHTVTGELPGQLAGWSVAGGGDANADGRADLLVGVPRSGADERGEVTAFSGKALALSSDVHSIDVTGGGEMNLYLSGGSALAGHFYFLLGTVNGTSPGIPTPIGVWPLAYDGYTVYTLSPSAHSEFVDFQGYLDTSGVAVAKVVIPPDSPPSFSKWQIHYGYATLDATLSSFPWSSLSNSVPLHFTVEGCDVADPALDCNGNGRLDSCDIEEGKSQDCNGNGTPDECEIAAGTAQDLDLDGIPDSCTTVVFVDASAVGAGTGADWANAITDLPLAISGAPKYSQVWVAAGTYLPTQNPLAREASIPMRNTVGVYGGFAGGETSLSQRDWKAHPTILNGDLLGDDVPGFVNHVDNCYTVVAAAETAGPTAVLDGFTVRGGSADLIVACDQYAIYFSNCRGGGLYTLGSPTIRNCVFEENYGGHHGGAVYILRSPTFLNCAFRRNGAIRGGAIYQDVGASPRYVSCAFEENQALEGGALYLWGIVPVQPLLVNCRLIGNTASATGGAIYTQSSRLSLMNCTLAGNTAVGVGGGLYGENSASTRFLNCVLWANTDSGGTGDAAQADGGAIWASYSCVQGLTSLPGPQNLGADPMFADFPGLDGVAGTADDDLRLLSGSPCVDSGNSSLLPADWGDLDGDGDLAEQVPLDLSGAARFQDDPATVDTGVSSGSLPVVDRGAYES